MHTTGLPSLLATDADRSGVAVPNWRNVFQTGLATYPAQFPSISLASVVGAAKDLSDKKSEGNVAPMIFLSNKIDDFVSNNLASDINIPDDSLYFFLKHFKVRSSQQPGHWVMFLVAFCFVLYQGRRRPLRTAIGFYSVPKRIGPAGLWQFFARSFFLSRKKQAALTQADATSGG
ncbi:hypothetical protein C7W93_02015 [Glaciimonas sp. PCH181]|nr:hypothetical protein C7W93_02015 [Glaciimonas sp. PCH181]